jgi:dipeptidyl aminopeptidase/acylaminoacyl peptidase
MRAITAGDRRDAQDVAFGEFEQFNFKGWNADTVHGYVVKPWNYRRRQEVPGRVPDPWRPAWAASGNGWSYRWNPQT